MPSIVVIALIPIDPTGSKHERTACPARKTVHAPHCAIPQPNFVPIRPMTSRSTHKSGMSGGTSAVCTLSLIFRVTIGCLHVRIIRVNGRASHANVYWEATSSADEYYLAPYPTLNNPPS